MEGFADSLQAMKAKGRAVIGCFPLYPPLELLHSFGLTPVVLWGMEPGPAGLPRSDRHIQPYACRVARCLTEFVLSPEYGLMDALFMYNACDTLRNLPEILEGALRERGRHLPVFRIHIPAVPLHREEAARYMEARIKGLVADLAAFTGRQFSEQAFLRSLRLYRRQRSLSRDLQIQAARGGLRFADFSEALMTACRLPVEDHVALLEKTLEKAGAGGHGGGMDKRRAVMISGILPPPRDLIEAMEAVGLVIAANDIAALARSCSSSVAESSDPAAYYTDFYRDHSPCTTMLSSSDRRLEAIRDEVLRHDIRGVVFACEKFCEYEYFEYPYLAGMLGEMGVRSLFIETGADGALSPDVYKTRIETFARMLDT